MKKVFFTIMMIMLLPVIAGCSFRDDKSDEDPVPQSLEWIVSENYTLSSTCDGITPYGIAVNQQTVIICDMEGQCLRKYGLDGNELGKVGQLGNGESEFIRPTGITYADGNFYVVDSGNNRIQILDSSLKYQSEIKLKKLSGNTDTYYTDIAISNDGSGILLSNSLIPEDARLFTFDIDGSVKKTSNIISGYLSCDANRIYCLNTFKLLQTDSSYEANMRESMLCEVEGDEIHDIFEFPYKYGPTDFVIEGDDIYVLSCGWAQLDHFRIDGSYVETIWDFDQLSPESFLAFTPQEGFVVTDKRNKAVYFFTRKSK